MKNRWPFRVALSIGPVAALLCALGCGGSFGSSPQPTGTTQPSFVISSTPATNPWPQSIAVADFNGDGKLDLAVPVYSIFTPLTDVNILLGNGDGTFTAGPAFPLTGQNVNNAVVADFNGDGKPDLAISLPDANEIQVLLGNGDGTFTPMPAISANGVFVVATGDFNRDGKADLVTVNCGPGTLTILLGNGDGTFTEGATITTPVTGPGGLAVRPVSVAVGDFNRDGIPDLAVANCPRFDQGATGSATVLLGNGDGTFTAEAESPAAGGQPLFITTGDFNGDGIPDLAVSNMNNGYPELGTLTVLLGNGDGTFTPTAVSPHDGFNSLFRRRRGLQRRRQGGSGHCKRWQQYDKRATGQRRWNLRCAPECCGGRRSCLRHGGRLQWRRPPRSGRGEQYHQFGNHSAHKTLRPCGSHLVEASYAELMPLK